MKKKTLVIKHALMRSSAYSCYVSSAIIIPMIHETYYWHFGNEDYKTEERAGFEEAIVATTAPFSSHAATTTTSNVLVDGS